MASALKRLRFAECVTAAVQSNESSSDLHNIFKSFRPNGDRHLIIGEEVNHHPIRVISCKGQLLLQQRSQWGFII
jgi:hypothetical protein